MSANIQQDDIKIFDKYCKTHHYYPAVLPARKRVIAVGDLHGDMNLTIRTLKLAKVIDDNGRWIGEDTLVVQVGDQLDSKRPGTISKPKSSKKSFGQDISVLFFMTELNEEAKRHGGGVVSLLGNHELMNVMGNMSYVSDEDIDIFGLNDGAALETRKKMFSPGNSFARLLGCSRNPVIIVGSFIFVHAGLVKKFMQVANISSTDDISKINYLVRKWLLGLIDKNNVATIINSSRYSMFWNRILGSIPPNMSNEHPDCVEHLNGVLETLNLNGMVIGHTPQSFAHNSKINSTCGNSLWRVDFGGSFGFDGFGQEENRRVQILEIIDDNDVRIICE